MLIPSDSRLAEWKYVEVAAFKTWADRESGKTVEAVVRDKVKTGPDDPGVPVFLEWGEPIREYMKRHNNCGIYTSVFRYNTPEVGAPTLGSLYFDFDHEADPDASLSDARKVYEYISKYVPSKYIRVYFTGSKGFHVEAEAIPLGIDPSRDLASVFRFIAEQLHEEFDLKTMDFAVYDPRRMWRLPNSQHQKTGLFKVELDEELLFASLDEIRKWAEEPRQLLSPECVFNPTANEWYKSWSALYEEKAAEDKAKARARRAELFNKYGTSIIKGHTRGYVNAAWRNTIKNLRATEPGKNRNLTLSRQAYKLYLTFLEANLPTGDVTNTLHEVALDIGLEDRETRATLRSALRAAEYKFETNPRGING